MQERRVGEKVFIIVVSLLTIGILAFLWTYRAVRMPDPVAIDTQGQPMIGSPQAKVEMVVFEDLRCEACREFTQTTFRKIESRYIETGKVRYTPIFISFLPGSKSLANAALAVYSIAPQQFSPFVQALFERFEQTPPKGTEKEILMGIARRLGGIDLSRLEECIDTRCYYEELEHNFFLAKNLMGNDLRTPALYINGVSTPFAPFGLVRNQIERALQQKEQP